MTRQHVVRRRLWGTDRLGGGVIYRKMQKKMETNIVYGYIGRMEEKWFFHSPTRLARAQRKISVSGDMVFLLGFRWPELEVWTFCGSQ